MSVYTTSDTALETKAWSHVLIIHLCHAIYAGNCSIDTPSSLHPLLLYVPILSYPPSASCVTNEYQFLPLLWLECSAWDMSSIIHPKPSKQTKKKKKPGVYTNACMPSQTRRLSWPSPDGIIQCESRANLYHKTAPNPNEPPDMSDAMPCHYPYHFTHPQASRNAEPRPKKPQM
jgi:hypothetical protein